MKNLPGFDEIMQMAIGFFVSKTLFAGVELGIFESLSTGPAEAEQLAERLKLPAESLERLLIALTALGLLEKQGERFANSASAEAYLLENSLSYMAGSFGHFDHDLYPLWNYLADAVRENSSRWKQVFG